MSFFTHSDAKMAVESVNLLRSKYGKDKKIYYERQLYEKPKQKDYLLAQYLESMRTPRSRKSNKSRKMKASPPLESSTNMKRFSSQPNLSMYNSRRPSTARKSTREMGAFAWSPMATNTAVGFSGHPDLSQTWSIGMSKKKRPISAPVYKINRSNSVSSIDTESGSLSLSASLVTSHESWNGLEGDDAYFGQHPIICVRAFRNGSREHYARVTAKNLHQLVEECTMRLGLVSAARKIFLPDGTLVTDPRLLHKDCDVYVSCGEAFKDPFQALRDKEKIKRSSSWTMNGIMLPQDKTGGKTKVTLSKRMRDLVDSQKRRILVFKNGASSEGVEIVAVRFDEFLDDCTSKLSLAGGARALYNWDGKEVESFSEVPALDEVLQPSTGSILGPIWVTKGERFSPKGAHDFLTTLVLNSKERIKKAKKRLAELQAHQSGKEITTLDILSMTPEQLDKEIKETDDHLTKLRTALRKLKPQLKIAEEQYREEQTVGNSYKFQHITAMEENNRLAGTKGYRLKLYPNGAQSAEPYIVYVSSKDFQRGKKTKEEMLHCFFDLLNSNSGLMEAFVGFGRTARFRRAFMLDGREVKEVSDIVHDMELWISCGEDFIPIEYDVLSVVIDKVKIVSVWGKKKIVQRDTWLGADETLVKQSLWNRIGAVPNECEEQLVKEEFFDELQKTTFINNLNNTRIFEEGVFLQNKKVPKLVLYPELQAAKKGREKEFDVWGQSIQEWIFNQDGVIANKHFPDLVLCIKDRQIVVQNGEEKYEGLAVGLTKRILGSPYQQWLFTSDGHVVCASKQGLHLTNVHELSCQAIYVKPKESVQSKPKKSDKDSSSNDESGDSSDDSKKGNNNITKESNDKGKFKEKKQKKKKKKDDIKKKKKTWWNMGIGSSSSSSSSDENESEKENGEFRKNSIKIKRKETSSEDEKAFKKKDDKMEHKDKQNLPEEDVLDNLPDVYGGEGICLAVMGMFPEKTPLRIRQRWAIKADDAPSLIASQTLSEKWKRQMLTWPVSETGNWSETIIQGCLLPNAPILKRKLPEKETKSSFYGQPARLKVLKNGEPDTTRAVIVVGPDLSNMKRAVNVSWPMKQNKGKGDAKEVPTAKVSEVEFHQFLERCTDSLGLPFAARRLFDENGKELHNLSGLERDQLVYVSSGDPWVDPNVTFSEQQRRSILANLASDVTKIRNYISLRGPSDLILQVDGPIHPGSRICLGKITEDERLIGEIEKVQDENIHSGENDRYPTCKTTCLSLLNGIAYTGINKRIDPDDMNDYYVDDTLQFCIQRSLHDEALTAHQRAHIRSNERLQSLRMAVSNPLGDTSHGDNIGTSSEDSDAEFTHPELGRKFSRSQEKESSTKLNPHASKQWQYLDGFIQLKSNTKLVLGVQTNEDTKGNQDIVICKKKLEEPYQRWIMSEEGFIHLKSNPHLVLTVSTPPLRTDPFAHSTPSQGYERAYLTLGRRQACVNGNSHQLFSLELDTGFIEAFSADYINLEITAANKSDVCTFSVLGSQNVIQPGYVLQETVKNMKESVMFCEGCGKAIRGKQKLQRLTEIKEFICAMGKAEEYGFNFTGSFKCLTSQVDLSSREADSSLALWEMQLQRLDKESSVRVIAYELHLAQTTPSVRIRAYKNGEGSASEGVIIIGNVINQILDQCTYRLGLPKAARKLYTIDGELITDMNQLLQPYYPELYFPMSSKGQSVKTTKKAKRTQNGGEWSSPSRSVSETSHPSEANSEETDTTYTLFNQKSRTNQSRSQSPSLSDKHVSFADNPTEELPDIPDIEKLDVRIPVDVWVSCGEPFVPLEDADKAAVEALRKREERSMVADYLEQEKHKLRQIQGRRLSGRTSTSGSTNAVKPVLSKAWTAPSQEEEKLEKSVEKLKVHLSEVKTKQDVEQKLEQPKRPRSAKKFEKSRERTLYDLPRGVSLQVYPNGELTERAVTVVASNMTELLDRATSRLDLTAAARRAFTVDGKEVFGVETLKKNQLVCVSCGEKFVPSRDRRHQIELRATWSRINKQGGIDSRDKVSLSKQRPLLALPSPPSPTLGTPAAKHRSPRHDESIHVFQKRSQRPKSAVM